MKTINTIMGYFFIIAIIGCKEDDAPENPCANAQEVKASFVIEELVGDRYFEGDTIAQLNSVRFRALQKADSYEWILGAETLRTQSFIRTNFPKGWLHVSLKLKRTPNNQCFPYDDGVDSVYRLFYVWPRNNDGIHTPPLYPYYPIYGTYRGYNQSNPNLLFNVTVFDTFWVNGQQYPRYVGLITGIPYRTSQWSLNNQNNTTLGGYCKGYVSPKAFNLSVTGYGKPPGAPCPYIPRVEGYGYLDRQNTNQITIEYSYSDTVPAGTQELKYHEIFVGQRIY